MTEQDLLKYCHFYKGEELVPQGFDRRNEGKLWVAEKFICEEIPHLIDEGNPRKSIVGYIESYVGKWAPYELENVMETYKSYVDNDH